MHWLDAARRAGGRLSYILCTLAGWLFVGCAIFISADVAGRNLFGITSQATVELSGYLLAIGMSWGFAYALYDKAHVRVDLLLNILPQIPRSILNLAAYLLLLVFAGMAAWLTIVFTWESWRYGGMGFGRLLVPLYVPQGLWAFGIVILCVMIVLSLAGAVAALAKTRFDIANDILGLKNIDEETKENLHL